MEDEDKGEVTVREGMGEMQEVKEPRTRTKHKAIICQKKKAFVTPEKGIFCL